MDVAFTNLGVVVFDLVSGTYVHFETIKTSPMGSKTVAEDTVKRCNIICDGLQRILKAFPIEYAVAELPTGGAKSAKALRGMMLSTGCVSSAMHCCKIPFTTFLSRQRVKKFMGTEILTKKDAITFVQTYQHKFAHSLLNHKINEHVADAMAICEVHLSDLENMS